MPARHPQNISMFKSTPVRAATASCSSDMRLGTGLRAAADPRVARPLDDNGIAPLGGGQMRSMLPPTSAAAVAAAHCVQVTTI